MKRKWQQTLVAGTSTVPKATVQAETVTCEILLTEAVATSGPSASVIDSA